MRREFSIASEIRTPPLSAFSPIVPLHHDPRAIQRPQAPTVKTRLRPSIQEQMRCATETLLDTAISNPI